MASAVVASKINNDQPTLSECLAKMVARKLKLYRRICSFGAIAKRALPTLRGQHSGEEAYEPLDRGAR